MNLKKRTHDLTEAVGVQFQQTLAHLRIVDEGLVGFLVNEVVYGTTGCTPTQSEVETLGHLSHTLIAGVEHAFVPLGIQQLGA